MTAKTPIGSSKVPQTLAFGTLAVGNANGTLYTAINTINEYPMMQSGWVIGVGAKLDGTLTTGTLQFTPTKNGALMANSFANGTINIGATGNIERQQAQQGGFAFSAGDTVGLMFQKTGTIAPTTRNLEALLLVLMDSYNY